MLQCRGSRSACLALLAGIALAGGLRPAMAGTIAVPNATAEIIWNTPVATSSNATFGALSFTGDLANAATYNNSRVVTYGIGGAASGSISANGQVLSVSDNIVLNSAGDNTSPDGITAFIQYYFVVNGPGSTVLVDVAATGFASALSAGFTNSAQFQLSDSNGTVVQQTVDPASGGSASFALNSAYTLAVGSAYEVQLTVAAYNNWNGPGGSAWVDPSFTIDPSVANSASYSVSYSTGVLGGAPPAVPEPDALWLLGSACLLLLGASRSRPARRP